MKKFLPLVIAAVVSVSGAAHASYLSPYDYKPKQPQVEVNMDALDDAGNHPATAEPAPSMQKAPMTPVPVTVNDLPAAIAPATVTPAPAASTDAFLDNIMSYHTGVKKKTAEPLAPVAPPKRVAPPKPVPAPLAVAPKAEEKPAPVVAEPKLEEKPAVAPIAAEPKAEEKAIEEKPVLEAAPAPEEKPVAPATRNNRKSPPASAPADMTVGFAPSSSVLTPDMEKSLDDLAQKMKAAPDMRLQLRAFATDAESNASNARRMSLSRGLVVRAYLIEKGVSPAAIDVRALGTSAEKPSDAVEVVFVK